MADTFALPDDDEALDRGAPTNVARPLGARRIGRDVRVARRERDDDVALRRQGELLGGASNEPEPRTG